MAKIFKECSFEFNNLTISGFAVTQDGRKFDAELLVLMSDSERYRMAVANVICTDSDGDFWLVAFKFDREMWDRGFAADDEALHAQALDWTSPLGCVWIGDDEELSLWFRCRSVYDFCHRDQRRDYWQTGDFCWGCPEGWEVDWMPDQMGEGKQ